MTTTGIKTGVTKVNVELIEGLVRVIISHQYIMEESDVAEEAKVFTGFCQKFDEKFQTIIPMKTVTNYDKETDRDMLIREAFYNWKYDRQIVKYLQGVFPDKMMDTDDVMYFWDQSKE